MTEIVIDTYTSLLTLSIFTPSNRVRKEHSVAGSHCKRANCSASAWRLCWCGSRTELHRQVGQPMPRTCPSALTNWQPNFAIFAAIRANNATMDTDRLPENVPIPNIRIASSFCGAVPIDFRLDGVRQVYGTARTKAARKEDSKVFTPFSVAPAALRYLPRSAAPQ
jgi:hypothetical protein